MLYKNLRIIRELRGYTQEDIADILKITRQQYHLYESGKREIPTHFVVELSNIYKLPTDCILADNYEEFAYISHKDYLYLIEEEYNNMIKQKDIATGEEKEALEKDIKRINRRIVSLEMDLRNIISKSK